MIYEILLPLPINKTFYYKHPESSLYKKIQSKGTLVEVEFRNKLLVGVIINLNKSYPSKRPLKQINKFLDPFFFNEEIIKSMEFISQYSCNKLSMILKLFLAGFSYKRKNLKQLPKVNFNPSEKKLEINTNQKEIINKIKKINFNQFNTILLEGVTGSGKTRVYMNKVKEVIDRGFQCLILVPEIILTTQWVDEIRRDFGLNPSVYHSSVKRKDREIIWTEVNNNRIKFVVGTRSALFLPFSKLGLLVIDEEHDSSYKQEEQVIINARDFAIVRAKNSNCMIILSSATPSLESFYNAKLNKFKLFRLSKRVNNINLPKVEIIDMRKEDEFISQKLKKTIEENLKNNFQTLIFINKRGYAPLVICRKCGDSKVCNNCNSSLVLHNFKEKSKSFLLCHHCNYKEVFSDTCSKCGAIGKFNLPGFGIEKIYEFILDLFPKANTCILSSDTIKKKKIFKNILSEIISNKIDIIIGTQLISKGHNFPSLKTVGILNIDNLANDSDFRSFEKTIQQVMQVGGRAGRKKLEGEVFVQTYQPNHPVMKLCKNNDIHEFFEWELKSRKKSQQPPYYNYISLIVSSKNEKLALEFSKKTFSFLKKNIINLPIFGPAPAIMFKKSLHYRFRLLIKLKKSNDIQFRIKSVLSEINTPNNVKFFIDVDPINFV